MNGSRMSMGAVGWAESISLHQIANSSMAKKQEIGYNFASKFTGLSFCNLDILAGSHEGVRDCSIGFI